MTSVSHSISAFDVVNYNSLSRKLHIDFDSATLLLIQSLHDGGIMAVKCEGAVSNIFHSRQGLARGGGRGGYVHAYINSTRM